MARREEKGLIGVIAYSLLRVDKGRPGQKNNNLPSRQK
jgi:hypothetical protein